MFSWMTREYNDGSVWQSVDGGEHWFEVFTSAQAASTVKRRLVLNAIEENKAPPSHTIAKEDENFRKFLVKNE